MDENEDYKKEIRTLEEEIEEMQDNFREEQADEYRDLKRELEQTAKNCRVLQFKLKKAERRSDAVSSSELGDWTCTMRLSLVTYIVLGISILFEPNFIYLGDKIKTLKWFQ